MEHFFRHPTVSPNLIHRKSNLHTEWVNAHFHSDNLLHLKANEKREGIEKLLPSVAARSLSVSVLRSILLILIKIKDMHLEIRIHFALEACPTSVRTEYRFPCKNVVQIMWRLARVLRLHNTHSRMYSIKWLNHNKKYFHEIKCRNAARPNKTYLRHSHWLCHGMIDSLEIFAGESRNRENFYFYFLRFVYEHYV